MIEWLKYCTHHTLVPGEISDVFDGMLYKNLLNKYVVVKGITLDHKYFSDRRDIAFGGSTDGFQVIHIIIGYWLSP